MKKIIPATLILLSGSLSHAALIAHYNGEEAASPIVDQAGGQTAAATDTGHIYSTAGPPGFGNSIGLNGNGSWQLSAGDSAELNLANNFTVAAWVYIDSATQAGKTGVSANNHRIIGDDAAWDADGWSFGVTNGIMRFTRNGIIDADDGSGTAIPLDQWVHLAATPTSTGIDFYLNGSLTGSNANGANNNTGLGNNGVMDPYAIGRSYGNGQEQWVPGQLDEIRGDDTVLTQSEIAGLMIPEPGSAALLGLGVLGFLARRRR